MKVSSLDSIEDFLIDLRLRFAWAPEVPGPDRKVLPPVPPVDYNALFGEVES